MWYWRSVVLFVLLLNPCLVQDSGSLRIDAPVTGSTVSGTLVISGSTSVFSFVESEISFSFEGSSDWFLLTTSQVPVSNGPLFSWDTTSIVDGVYQVRVRVKQQNGQFIEVISHNIRISNEPEITPTVGPTRPEVKDPTLTMPANIDDRAQTPTALPKNDASLAKAGLSTALLFGSGIAVGLIMCILILQKSKGRTR